MPGMSALTVRFEVGEPRTEAIVRLYNAFYSNQDWLPAGTGVGMPLIKPKGIDDVPIVAATLWSESPEVTAADLLRLAHAMEGELQRVPGTRDIETIGGPDRVVHVVFDAQRLAGYGLALDDLRRALSSANASADAGRSVADDREILVQAGTFLTTPEEIADLVVGVRDGAPVFLRDVAEVREAGGPARTIRDLRHRKRSRQRRGRGALPRRHHRRVEEARRERGGRRGGGDRAVRAHAWHPLPRRRARHDHARLRRDRGDKARTLILQLSFATLSVTALVLLLSRLREAVVVGAVAVGDARAHVVRLLGLGLHAQPGLVVRADFLDRHSGRRRDRRGREHYRDMQQGGQSFRRRRPWMRWMKSAIRRFSRRSR